MVHTGRSLLIDLPVHSLLSPLYRPWGTLSPLFLSFHLHASHPHTSLSSTSYPLIHLHPSIHLYPSHPHLPIPHNRLCFLSFTCHGGNQADLLWRLWPRRDFAPHPSLCRREVKEPEISLCSSKHLHQPFEKIIISHLIKALWSVHKLDGGNPIDNRPSTN